MTRAGRLVLAVRLAAVAAPAALLTGAGTALAADAVAEAAEPDAKPPPDPRKSREWFYLDVDGGFSYVNMSSFSKSTLQEQNASAEGPAFGAGLGVRLFFLTLGVRGTLNDLSSFNLWQMDAELGVRPASGSFQPFFGLHGGYCFVGSLDDALTGMPTDSIYGGDVGLQLGLDYYFNHFISLGAGVSGNALFLHGAPPPLPAGGLAKIPKQDQVLYQESGDSAGFGFTAALHLGVHL